jgi:hypothetical protein
LKRIQNYPNGTRLLLQIICNNCDNLEKELIQLFKSKYKIQTDIGKEYFKGNHLEMIQDIYKYIYNINLNNSSKFNNNLNPYQLFVKEQIKNMKDNGSSLNGKELMKEIAFLWKQKKSNDMNHTKIKETAITTVIYPLEKINDDDYKNEKKYKII